MAFVYVQQSNATNTSSGTSLAMPAVATTAGNHLFVHVRWEAANTTASVTDSAGNAYTAVTPPGASGQNAYSQWFYCLNAKGSASNVVTVAWASAMVYRAIRLMEFSASSPVFGQRIGATTASGSSTISVGPFNTAAAGLVLVGVSQYNSEGSNTFSAGYTAIPAAASNLSKHAYRITTGALSSETVTYTGSGTTSRAMDVLTLTEGSSFLTYSYAATGGLVLAGVAARVTSKNAAAAGGVTLSGAGTTLRGRVRAVAGGLILSGAAVSIRSRLRTVAGGLILSGAAAVTQTAAVQARVVSAVGGVLLSGAATVRRGVGRATAGGISFAGSAGLAFASTFRRALVLIGVTLQQIKDADLATGKAPIVLVNGRLRRRQAAEGTPLVLDNGEVRPLASDETLKI